MYKKLLMLFGVLALSVTLTACSAGQKAGKYRVYDTKITKVSNYEQGDWIIKGTTEAPDGAKIMITPTKKAAFDYKRNGGYNTNYSWAKAKDGKFKIIADGIYLPDLDNEDAGDKVKVRIFAVTGLKTSFSKMTRIPKSILKTVKDKFETYDLKITKKQADYFDSLDDDLDDTYDTDEDYEDSEDLEAALGAITTGVEYQAVTYDQLARTPDNFKYKPVTVSGKVTRLENSTKGAIVLLSQDDNDNSPVMVSIPTSYMPTNGKILEGDELTICGYSSGTQKYDDTDGTTSEVPLIFVSKITVDNGQATS